MGTFSIWHWIIVLLVVLLLFGAGKIPRLMGDVAKGVKAFKKGLADDDDSDGSGESRKIEGENTAASERKKDEASNG
ncbi:twin-arginine translocase TatA/TatE family subunit [Rhodospira trueperi]|jgi:sec-independent protein translocase protein TatA|uniref:Sec-independent protein translocase protein TatA n=1 Tax=Rhodospira trueperi TaxID=69960 RepID=A0A1G6WJI1_9PROT|nr:twin-arginine translocase TatA/TatE family subunit [Rhodospira trueperi]SDD66032.1 sec-independent protein translocase protein TatA [Rhodospira trueperi]